LVDFIKCQIGAVRDERDLSYPIELKANSYGPAIFYHFGFTAEG